MTIFAKSRLHGLAGWAGLAGGLKGHIPDSVRLGKYTVGVWRRSLRMFVWARKFIEDRFLIPRIGYHKIALLPVRSTILDSRRGRATGL